MGIDLVQEHAKAKAQWISSEMGMVEGDEGFGAHYKYIMKKHQNVRETPANRTGNKISFNRRYSSSSEETEDDFTRLSAVESHGDNDIDEIKI